MKHLLLISALAFASCAIAQEGTGTPAPSAFDRVLFGLNASADQCYQNTKDLSDDGATAMAPWNDEYQPQFGYTAGLKVQYNFTLHWGVGVGAQYANRGYASERTSHWIMVDPLDPAIPRRTTFRYNHSFIDIPIRLIFQAGQKRVRFTSSLGIAGNVLLHVSTVRKLEYEDGHMVRTRSDFDQGYRHVNLSAIGSMGAVYQFTARSSLQLEPSFLYNLFPIDESTREPILWSGGVDLTFFYALR